MTTRPLNAHDYGQGAIAAAAHARIGWMLGDRTGPCPTTAKPER